MFNKLPRNVLLYCILPYLQDTEMRTLSALCKRTNKIVHEYCLADKTPVNDLCKRGDLLIIYKRNLIVMSYKGFDLICKRGYVNLIEKSFAHLSHIKSGYILGIIKACKKGHYKTVKLLVGITCNDEEYKKSVSFELGLGLEAACIRNHRKIIDLLISELYSFGARSWGHGLEGACYGGHRKIIDLMISLLQDNKLDDEDRVESWNQGLRGACRGGHREIVDLMISLLNNYGDWNGGLRAACIDGHLEIVKLMIEKGAHSWYGGLHTACENGHIEIVKLMIEKGADSWDIGLQKACENGHIEIVKLMIEKGADNWNDGLFAACIGEHYEIVKLMIEKGATECGACYKSVMNHYK